MLSKDSKASHICWICGHPTPLETCKVDENGLPVHEACQALKFSLQSRTVSNPTASTAESRHRPKAG